MELPIHTGDKPFECNQGDKMLSLKVAFANHQTIHSGEIPYKYDYSSAKYSPRSSLVTQQITYTAEKSYNVICIVNILYLKVIA